MFGYYLTLAIRSFRRDRTLTVLMMLALGAGIGASMTMLTLLKLLSGDPLPQTSARLFTPSLNPTDATDTVEADGMPRWWGNLMTYTDAMNLLRAHAAERQAVMALAKLKLIPPNKDMHPFFSDGVVTTSEFFAMFSAPFQFGSGWTLAGEQAHARQVVIGSVLNTKLFGGKNSLGQTLQINDAAYRIIGVLKPWAPQPRFYAVSLGGGAYGHGDMVFMPLQSARADNMSVENFSCWTSGDFRQLETAPCAWVSLWVELSAPGQAAGYKWFLSNYAHQQMAMGRFSDSRVWLYSLTGFLDWQRLVPSDVRSQTAFAFGFLLICMVNTIGLLLAKCLRRSREIGVRRALGASRRAIFIQFLIESGMVGVAGGLLGLMFAEVGLWIIRHTPTPYAALAHLDVAMMAATFGAALAASLISGFIPAWRACVLAPAPQLKSA